MYYSTELVFVVRTNNILHPRNPVFHEGCNIIFHKIAVFSTLMFISRVVSEALFQAFLQAIFASGYLT